jgi:ferritin-like metal-binding protein YciE
MAQTRKSRQQGRQSNSTRGRRSSNQSNGKSNQNYNRGNGTEMQNKRGSNRGRGRQSSSPNNGQSGSLLEQLFTDQLKDIYYAEQLLVKALSKMADASTTEELEDAFSEHLQQTERHVKRLEKVFQMIGKRPEGKKCEAMEGLVKEAESLIKETKEGTMTRDAALIIAAQKVEHYEIATYGSLLQLAITMGLHRASDVLDKTLMEEGNADGILTHIAETYINLQAEQEGGYSWEQGKEDEESGENNDDEGEYETSEGVSTPGVYSM